MLLYMFPIYFYGYFRLIGCLKCTHTKIHETKAVITGKTSHTTSSGGGHGSSSTTYFYIITFIITDEINTAEYLIQDQQFRVSETRYKATNNDCSTLAPLNIIYIPIKNSGISKDSKPPLVPLRFGCDFCEKEGKFVASKDVLSFLFGGSISTATGLVCFIMGNIWIGIATIIVTIIETLLCGLNICINKIFGKSCCPCCDEWASQEKQHAIPITDEQKQMFQEKLAIANKNIGSGGGTDGAVPLQVNSPPPNFTV